MLKRQGKQVFWKVLEEPAPFGISVEPLNEMLCSFILHSRTVCAVLAALLPHSNHCIWKYCTRGRGSLYVWIWRISSFLSFSSYFCDRRICVYKYSLKKKKRIIVSNWKHIHMDHFYCLFCSSTVFHLHLCFGEKIPTFLAKSWGTRGCCLPSESQMLLCVFRQLLCAEETNPPHLGSVLQSFCTGIQLRSFVFILIHVEMLEL